jgi:hypothetical protein
LKERRRALHDTESSGKERLAVCTASAHLRAGSTGVCSFLLAGRQRGQRGFDRSSTSSQVPPAARLATAIVAPTRSTRSVSPIRPDPRSGSARPTPSPCIRKSASARRLAGVLGSRASPAQGPGLDGRGDPPAVGRCCWAEAGSRAGTRRAGRRAPPRARVHAKATRKASAATPGANDVTPTLAPDAPEMTLKPDRHQCHSERAAQTLDGVDRARPARDAHAADERGVRGRPRVRQGHADAEATQHQRRGEQRIGSGRLRRAKGSVPSSMTLSTPALPAPAPRDLSQPAVRTISLPRHLTERQTDTPTAPAFRRERAHRRSSPARPRRTTSSSAPRQCWISTEGARRVGWCCFGCGLAWLGGR